jgi:hypothetical protein
MQTPTAAQYATQMGPSMIQYFTAPKSSRGSRLGRGADSTSTMEQYGSSAPGTNITVSPTFSDIGNPAIAVEGMSVGDVSLSNQRDSFSESGPGGIQTTRRPTPPRPGGGGGGVRNGSGSGGGGNQQRTLTKSLQQAVKTGQDKNPRATRLELKSIMEKTGTGPIALRNAIREGDIKLGELSQNFLNRQLEGKGAKPLGPVSGRTPGKPQNTRTTPAPKPGQQARRPGQVQPFNSGSNPMAPFQQMMQANSKPGQPRPPAPKVTAAQKAAAAKKAQAKAKAQTAKRKK